MAKREYSGPPLDGTEQYISNRDNNGETIAGTTEDDKFEQRTTLVPDDIDADSISEKQWSAIRAFQVEGNPDDPSVYSIANGRDFSADTARSAIHKVFRSTRDIEDIPPSARLGVLIWAYEGMDNTQTELADKYPISARAFQEAKSVYPDLIEEFTEITKQELDKAVEQYKNNKKESVGKSTQSDPEKNDSTSEKTNNIYQTPKEEKEYPEDFTETYQWFIEKISDDPSKSKQEIESEIPDEKEYSGQSYYNTVRNYPDVIAQRIKEKETASGESDLCEYLQKHITLDEGSPTESAERESENEPENEQAGGKSEQEQQNGEVDSKQFGARLKSVESKVESLRQEVGDTDQGESENVELARIIVDAVPDEKLGQLIKQSFRESIEGDVDD